MKHRKDTVEEITLVSFDAFQKKARGVLSNTKRESDKQLAEFQAANVKRREAKKKR